MNKQEYEEYQERVADFMLKENLEVLDCGSEEASFSWQPCECCGSTLGGDRHDVAGRNTDNNEVYHYDVCMDCYYYAEYGRLDDTTMVEIENS